MEATECVRVDGLECIEVIDNHEISQEKPAACTEDVNGFCTDNAGGELYAPKDVAEVRARAAKAGKRFFSVFSKNA